MNKDKSRPYFATVKNSILKKNPGWIEEIEYTLGVMNDPNNKIERRDAARDTLLNYTYTRPTVAETQPHEQLGFNLQWENGASFDPATLSATSVAEPGALPN